MTKSERFVKWTLRHGRAIWMIALLLAIPATWRTAQLYMHLRSELEELLPRQSPSVLAIDELRARMPGLQYLGVVVDVGTPENLPAGERFIDDLAERVKAYPPELARSVRKGRSEERTFLEAHAPLYVELQDLRTIRERVEARRDWEVIHNGDLVLDDSDKTPAPSLDFSDIEKKYDSKLPKGNGEKGDRYSSKDLHLTMLLIEAGSFETGNSAGKQLLERVQADVAALGGPAKYATGMRMGYSGDVAINVEETSALVSDLSISSVLVIVAVVAVIVLYYRWWRSIVILLPPLLLATVYAFGIASLPPFRVTELNSNTAFLGSIIVGNGINFGIVLLARYVEERRNVRSVVDSLVLAVSGARVGTLSAALAAGASYASLIITEFRGFRQFGYIGGIGMVLSWAVSFVLMPPLVAWLDRNEKTAPKPRREDLRFTAFVARFVDRFRVPIVLAGVALTALAMLEIRRFDASRLEYDFSKLRRADTWESGEGYWGKKMDSLLGEYLTPIVILGDDPAEAHTIAKDLADAASHDPLADMIASVRSADDILPPDQAAKIAEAKRIRKDMTPKIRSLIEEGKRDEVDRLLGKKDLAPIAAADLPHTFTAAMREKDGTLGKTVLVYPRHPIWDGPALDSFVTDLRGFATHGAPQDKPARVAGSLPLSADILSSIQRDGPLASAAAFLGVVAVVFVLFRFRSTTAYVLAALCVGVLWLAGAMMLLGVKINFANFIAFPITFGIGVDYAVNVMSRYDEDGRRDVLGTIRATGSAVALCSLTTIIGYSSLLMAQNRALYLFGLVAVMGEVACLTAAITFLPATLLAFRPRPRTAPAE